MHPINISTTHYETTKRFRFLFIVVTIIIQSYFTAIAVFQRNWYLIGSVAFLGIFHFPYVIWLSAFRKYRTCSLGITVPNPFNPFKSTLVPWNSIQKVTPDGATYIIALSDGKTHEFSLYLQKFDLLLDSFRSRGIPIDTKPQRRIRVHITCSRPPIDDENDNNSNERELFIRPSRTVSSTSRRFTRFFIGILFLLISLLLIVILGMTFHDCSYMTKITLLLFASLLMVSFLALCTVNGDITIQSDGVLFHRNAKFVPWNEFRYVRMVELSSDEKMSKQEARFHVEGEEDCVASVPEGSDAFEPLLIVMLENKVPLLEETEPFNNNQEPVQEE